MFDFGKPAKTSRGESQEKTRGSVSSPTQPHVDVLQPVEPNATQTRSTERFVPRRTGTSLTTAKGKRIDGRIVNLSAAGVAVEVNLSQIGTDPVVMVGSRPVHRGRPIALGMVFLFVKPIDPSLCNPDIIL